MKKPGPIYVARINKIPVPVYGSSDGTGRFNVTWRAFEGAPRTREYFRNKQAAIDRAEEIARALANGQADVLTLSGADRDTYRLAMQKVAPFNTTLLNAVEEWSLARKIVAPHTLIEAANFFRRGDIERSACPATPQILTELLARLRDDRRDDHRYIGPLERDLTPFAGAYPDLRAVTEDDIRAYLRSLVLSAAVRDRATGEMRPQGAPVGPRRRDNVRDAIVTLMRFARKKDYLPHDKTSPAELIPHIHELADVSTYSPERLIHVLNYFATTEPVWLPWAAIAAFAGLRTTEIYRLDWSAFHWADTTIAVSNKVARKIRISRHAPLLPNLVAWLQPWRNQTHGPVIERRWKDVEAAHTDALARLRSALGWHAWDNNALRHSFGSHRLAILKDIAALAVEMGNSPAKIREHYNDPKPESVATRYFALLPADPVANVVAFKSSGT